MIQSFGVFISLFLALQIFAPLAVHANNADVKVGSKKFTESVILGEMLKLSLNAEGINAHHEAELGGSRILWNALLSGDIDAYPEYTGTISEELLQTEAKDFETLKNLLDQKGIGITRSLGFNDTYALGMNRDTAEELAITKISDLAQHPQLRIGLGEEFRQRKDGWPGLKALYRLPFRSIKGLDHDIAYRALQNKDIDLTDLYSTDPEIEHYKLVVLEDDLHYFPKYEAVYLYRLKTAQQRPKFLEILNGLTGQINEATMIRLNLQAKIENISSEKIAADFLNQSREQKIMYRADSREDRILARTAEHLKLVGLSLLAAILFAVPLGIFAAKWDLFGRLMLWVVGAIQTIPALALLVVLIKPLNILGLKGIGDTPALIALFLYSLLPIVRGTHSGFEQIPLSLRETASVLGLSDKTKLLKIEFPLALPSILSGIKTAAVINIGFATLGALVGAGGYGQPILTGIRLDNYGLILEGAIPSAILALLIQLLFDLIERRIVSPGLRKNHSVKT